jgi:hypothetical protein
MTKQMTQPMTKQMTKQMTKPMTNHDNELRLEAQGGPCYGKPRHTPVNERYPRTPPGSERAVNPVTRGSPGEEPGRNSPSLTTGTRRSDQRRQAGTRPRGTWSMRRTGGGPIAPRGRSAADWRRSGIEKSRKRDDGPDRPQVDRGVHGSVGYLLCLNTAVTVLEYDHCT